MVKKVNLKLPGVPFIDVWVQAGGRNLHLWGKGPQGNVPQYIKSLTMTRRADNSANNVVIVVVDRNWSEVESLLMEAKQIGGKSALRLQYGWADGNKSPVYEMSAVGWSSTIHPYGTEITIEGISSVCVNEAGLTEGKKQVWQEKRVSDIVRKIAKEMNYKVDIVETKPIEVRSDNLKSTKKEPMKIEQGNLPPLTFIADVLTKQAISEKGEGDYVCWVDDDTKTIHFKPRKEISDTPIADYVVWSDPQSVVMSWTVDVMTELLKGIESAGTLGIIATDRITGKKVSHKVSNQNTENKVLDGPKSLVSSETKNSDSSNIVMIAPASKNLKVPKAWAMNAFLTLFNTGGYNAQMTVVGDPLIRVNTLINVWVYTGDGKSHYTSGQYLITEVTDVLQSGFYYTEMQLQRNAGEFGKEKAKGK